MRSLTSSKVHAPSVAASCASITIALAAAAAVTVTECRLKGSTSGSALSVGGAASTGTQFGTKGRRWKTNRQVPDSDPFGDMGIGGFAAFCPSATQSTCLAVVSLLLTAT